jgi:hypothetical protein
MLTEELEVTIGYSDAKQNEDYSLVHDDQN